MRIWFDTARLTSLGLAPSDIIRAVEAQNVQAPIRERFDQTGDNTGSVAYGLRTTGGIITGAALIMAAVFWGFAVGDMVSFQQMGFGLGMAVLIDATIVRSVLVPAAMKLLGDANWYLPRWLQWLPRLTVEASEPEPALPAAAPAEAPERIPAPVG